MRQSVGERPVARHPFLVSTVAQQAAARSAANAPAAPPVDLQVVLFALGAVICGFTILRGISLSYEGTMLQAGARIAGGQWPYRDFWSNYPPGQPLVLAALHRVFGASLLAWRVLYALTGAAVALGAYLLAWRRAPGSYALLAWLAGGVRDGVRARSRAQPDRARAGARRTAGGAAAAGPGRGAGGRGLPVPARVRDRGDRRGSVEAPRGQRLRAVGVAVLCAAVTLAPFFVLAPRTMLHDTIGFYGIEGLQRPPFPLGYHGHVGFGRLLAFYLPLILLVGCVLWAVAMAILLTRPRPVPHANVTLRGGIAARARQPTVDPGSLSAAPLAIVGVGYLLARTDQLHLVPLAVVLPVLLATAAASAPSALRATLLAAVALIALVGVDHRAGQALHPPPLARVPGPAGDGVKTSPADARWLASLERTVGRLAQPGQPIFVTGPAGGRAGPGGPLLYVILGHPNPTRYDAMTPGVVTTATTQREIVSSLRASGVRVVIRVAAPGARSTTADANILDGYLSASFAPGPDTASTRCWFAGSQAADAPPSVRPARVRSPEQPGQPKRDQDLHQQVARKVGQPGGLARCVGQSLGGPERLARVLSERTHPAQVAPGAREHQHPRLRLGHADRAERVVDQHRPAVRHARSPLLDVGPRRAVAVGAVDVQQPDLPGDRVQRVGRSRPHVRDQAGDAGALQVRVEGRVVEIPARLVGRDLLWAPVAAPVRVDRHHPDALTGRQREHDRRAPAERPDLDDRSPAGTARAASHSVRACAPVSQPSTPPVSSSASAKLTTAGREPRGPGSPTGSSPPYGPS